MIVPHYLLSKVPFCAVPITEIDKNGGVEKSFLGDLFCGGIWMVLSISIAVHIDRKKKSKEPKKLSDCKVVSTTCPSVILREQYNKTLRDEIGKEVKKHVHIEDPYPPRTKIKMSKDLKDCDVLHLTCHGVFAGGRDVLSIYWSPSKVLCSSVLSFRSIERELVNEEEKELRELNMVDIWGLNLRECHLANVVACSGGTVNSLSDSDENLSIGTGFLVGGARNVICCLWPVEEIVAAATISQLYKNMCEHSKGEEDRVWKIGEHLARSSTTMVARSFAR